MTGDNVINEQRSYYKDCTMTENTGFDNRDKINQYTCESCGHTMTTDDEPLSPGN